MKHMTPHLLALCASACMTPPPTPTYEGDCTPFDGSQHLILDGQSSVPRPCSTPFSLAHLTLTDGVRPDQLTFLSELESVGSLTIEGTTELTDLPAFENLHTIRVELLVYDNQKLETLNAFETLESSTFIRLIDNPALQVVHFPALTTLTVDFTLHDNPQLRQWPTLDQLETIRILDVRRNDQLETVGPMPRLAIVHDHAILEDLPRLENVRIPDPAQAIDALTLRRLPAITRLPRLRVYTELYLDDLPLLEELSFEEAPNNPLGIAFTNLSLRNLPRLTTIQGLDRLTLLNSLELIQLDALESFHLPDGPAPYGPIHLSRWTMEDLPRLRDIHVDPERFDWVFKVELANLPQLERVENLRVHSGSSLQGVDAEQAPACSPLIEPMGEVLSCLRCSTGPTCDPAP